MPRILDIVERLKLKIFQRRQREKDLELSDGEVEFAE